MANVRRPSLWLNIESLNQQLSICFEIHKRPGLGNRSGTICCDLSQIFGAMLKAFVKTVPMLTAIKRQ